MTIILLACFISVNTANNILLKCFQKSANLDKAHNALYLCLNGLFAMIYFFAACRFNVAADGITLLYSLIYALIVSGNLFFRIFAFKHAKIAVVSVISDGGSFVMSTLLGVLLFSEHITAGAVFAVFLRLCAIVIPGIRIFKEKSRILGIVFCALNAAAAAMSVIFLKIYTLDTRVADASVMFFWVNAFLFIICGFVFGKEAAAIIRETPGKQNLPRFSGVQIVNIILMTACANTGSALSVHILRGMEVYLFNVLSGALTLLSVTLSSRLIFKEKVTKDMLWSIILSILALVTMSLR